MCLKIKGDIENEKYRSTFYMRLDNGAESPVKRLVNQSVAAEQ